MRQIVDLHHGLQSVFGAAEREAEEPGIEDEEVEAEARGVEDGQSADKLTHRGQAGQVQKHKGTSK